ncbi:hypothetical protein BATDEDRAFT_86702 [Batrachochytrium dendrobatidis JAM81]|uniref:Uncharacterized protein n=1 Tax=Batrachochytrium dendrobatidis (strain JAM81 / FGSC 10211) TaxID=684364 RepID=F4NWU5_BATDJ|nr:uncharacterized protein BATDEDRAFT_86702 [Batrachochytrium dendrobatidis JAM81]EGF82550.1 hypothetical protein BATDEDRAFT_86702 [Batrachochytrium dendrobatidis JAM81]|eukprot:XP_006676966.1 hypothetical protein BATDEDRAFT_86702 [Batrachochytrium dendrobatidis JAM81]
MFVYMMAHPDLFLTDLLRTFWQAVAAIAIFTQQQAPRLMSYIVSATPSQILVLLSGCLAIYFVLYVTATLMQGILKTVVLLVKTVVFCCVLVLAFYVLQAYVLARSGGSLGSPFVGLAGLIGQTGSAEL